MSHYADYVKERLGKSVLECEGGFAVYYFYEHPEHGKVVYLEEIYVAPAHRKFGVATLMAKKIEAEAAAKGIDTMLGSVNPDAEGATASLKVLLAYGMTLDGVDRATGLIIFFKTIGD